LRKNSGPFLDGKGKEENAMKHTDIINSLSLEQKCALLSGGTVFTTRALPGKGIPAITLSDGPASRRAQLTIWA
jgi:hypothetical protein